MHLITAISLLLVSAPLPGQNKKPEKKDQPQVRMAIPLGVSPGVATKITVRGLKLDAATEVRFPDSKATGKIASKGKAPLSNNNAGAKEGDTQVVVEVTLPADAPLAPVALVVVTPAGETSPHRLLVEDKARVTAEKEPNNGFRQAQAIQFPQAIDGVIDHPRDVDVFRFEGQAGQKVRFEVFAARHGSALDSLLTLYGADGHELAANDDHADSRDSLLEFTLPRSGTYYLSLIDANDQGGKAFPYRLTARLTK